MRDRGHRRSSVSLLAGLNHLPGLAALAEEDAGLEKDEENLVSSALAEEISSQNEHQTLLLGAAAVLPPIKGGDHDEHVAADEHTELPPARLEPHKVETRVGKKQQSHSPSGTKGKKTHSRLQYSRIKTDVEKTPIKTEVFPLTYTMRRERDTHNNLSSEHTFSPNRQQGYGETHGEEGEEKHRLSSRRHSTETEQPDTRYNIFRNGKLPPTATKARPRASTWGSGDKSGINNKFKKYNLPLRKNTEKSTSRKMSLPKPVPADQDVDRSSTSLLTPSPQLLPSPRADSSGDFSIPERPRNARGRRWSRPDFAETNRRVAMLLRAARAKKRRGERRPSLPTPSILQEDLPKMPRFSSFMSAEAQYALMQGYEDRLVEWLGKRFPGNIGLRRSSMPADGAAVQIRRRSLVGHLHDDEDDEEKEFDLSDSDHNNTDSDSDLDDNVEENINSFGGRSIGVSPETSFFKTLNTRQIENYNFYLTEEKISPRTVVTKERKNSLVNAHFPTPTACSFGYPIQAMSNSSSFQPSSTRRRSSDACSVFSKPPQPLNPRAALNSLRRLSNPLTRRDISIRKIFGDHEADSEEEDHIDSMYSSLPLRRHGSLPTVSYTLPSDRRLAISQRLENAMDILDTLRLEQGANVFLSPRPKVRQRRVTPLADYNTWVSQWGLEFKVAKEKA